MRILFFAYGVTAFLGWSLNETILRNVLSGSDTLRIKVSKHSSFGILIQSGNVVVSTRIKENKSYIFLTQRAEGFYYTLQATHVICDGMKDLFSYFFDDFLYDTFLLLETKQKHEGICYPDWTRLKIGDFIAELTNAELQIIQQNRSITITNQRITFATEYQFILDAFKFFNFKTKVKEEGSWVYLQDNMFYVFTNENEQMIFFEENGNFGVYTHQNNNLEPYYDSIGLEMKIEGRNIKVSSQKLSIEFQIKPFNVSGVIIKQTKEGIMLTFDSFFTFLFK